jgi:hypothetical protein
MRCGGALPTHAVDGRLRLKALTSSHISFLNQPADDTHPGGRGAMELGSAQITIR